MTKRSGFIPLAVAFFLTVLISFSDQGGQPKTHAFVLDNGLRVFLYEKHTLPLLHIVAGVDIGSKDETDETSGLTHLLEHSLVFRGTEFRSPAEINQGLRRHGAYLNAHTGQDFMLIEMSLPSENAEFALGLEKEILFHLRLSQEALGREKEVILEEISQVLDDPLKRSVALIYERLFAGHPYSRPIIGRKETVQAITLEQVLDTYQKYFVPANCVLAVCGDFGIAEMEEKIRAAFGGIEKKDKPDANFPHSPLLKDTLEIDERMDVNQAYLVLGMAAPDYNSPDQYPMDVLVHILGRGINPLLHSALKGQRDLVQKISLNYISHKYGGTLLVFLTLEEKNIGVARKEAVTFLKSLRSQNFSPDDYTDENRFTVYDHLAGAKNQIKFNLFQSRENGLNMAGSLAIYMLCRDDSARGNYLDEIEKTNSSGLRQAAANYLTKGDCVVLAIRPLKKTE